jgi:peptide deformylase
MSETSTQEPPEASEEGLSEPLEEGGEATPAKRPLTNEERRARDAALAEIRVFGDPVLKSKASALSDFGPELRDEVERMVSLMHGAMGVGLAATQIGVLRRLLVFQAGPDATPRALANPVIEWFSDELATATEGCLSIPRIAVDVERSLHVRVSAQDETGAPLTIEASGLEARVLQHEVDHLDGVLMLDRTSREQRKLAMRALREGDSFTPDDFGTGEEEPEVEATPS